MKKNRSWPYGLTLFYTFFVAAVVGFAFWSGFHRVDLVTKNYYADEIAYQDRIDSRDRALALESPPSVTYAENQVRIQFATAPDTGTAVFYRPSDASLDQSHPISLDEQGTQQFDASGMESGLWKVQLTWVQDGQDYFLEQPLTLN